MRRAIKVAALIMAATALFSAVLIAVLLLVGNTDSGRRLIEHVTGRLSAGKVVLRGLGGSFPTRLTLAQLQLRDRGGVWLTADHIELTWSPLRLLENRIQIDLLGVQRLHVERAPVSDGQGGAVSFPTIDVGHVSISVAELGAPLVGQAASLTVQGGLRLRSLDEARASLQVNRLDGDGQYTVAVQIDPHRVDASLLLKEPAGGPLENLLGLPGLGALDGTVTVRGQRDAEAVDLELAAGSLQAKVQGMVDLTHRSANVDYSLRSEAMAPRSDLAWKAVMLTGNWRGSFSAPAATGRLQIDQLQLAGPTRLNRLSADLTATNGRLGIEALAQGLEISGPQPRFFAAAPLKLEASIQLDAPTRPAEWAVTHPLLSMRGHAATTGGKSDQLSGMLEVRIPELAPFSVFTGQDLRGSALLDARLSHQPRVDAVTLDAKLDLTGGAAAWVGLAGPRITLQSAGSLTDTTLKIDSLRLVARPLTFTASGSAERAAPLQQPDTRDFLQRMVRQLQLRWQMDAADLALFSTDLAGELKMTGTITGPPTAMAAVASVQSHLSVHGSSAGLVKASVQARGLPRMPSASLQANGELDGSPLSVDVALERGVAGVWSLGARRAEWKSMHLEGDVSTASDLSQTRGLMSLRVGQLGDLQHLLGVSISGSADASARFVPAHGKTQAELHLDGKHVVMGAFAGDLHVQGTGSFDALAVQLSATMPNLSGLPADLTVNANLDLAANTLRLESGVFDYHDLTLKLLAPARLSYANGILLDDLKVGAADAVLELRGALAPLLDVRASVKQVKPSLINVFAPGLLAGGGLGARARLQGTAQNPTGRVVLDARDIRFADDVATGLPALSLHAGAELDGHAAAITIKLDAGTASRLTASGSAPLSADGLLDLKIGGMLDVGLMNPFLEARGMHATGTLRTDATVTGSWMDPQVGGSLTLAQGSLRDYARGLSLTDIAADIAGAAGTLQIKSLSAKAASGSVAMSGSLGVLQPGMPIDLHLVATRAQPIASNILTANLDADMRINGKARERIDVAGTVHVNRAAIGIPDSLPPEVAVLDVRRRGQSLQATTDKQLVIGIDVVIKAPQEVLVQGRGLDAEMGGEIRLNGTSDALVASGGLDLLRGSFTISGNKLTFSPDSKIRFEGAGLQKKIDPTLDFSAQTTIGATTATLRITGLADAPRFDFSSSPELPPDQIMALLLFGQPAAQLSALQVAQVGYALATLTGVGNGGSNPLVKLQKSLGLDRLTVGTNTVSTATGGTENSGAAIAAGRYISKRVYVEGKQTTSGTSQVQVDVDLTKRLKLQTRLGNGTATVQGTTPENDPGSSIGLLYQFEY